MKWSQEQEDIIAEGKLGRTHFVVQARAGTGKTTVIKAVIEAAPEPKKVYLAFNKRNVEEAKTKITTAQVMSLNGLGHRFVAQNWGNVKPDDEVEFDRITACKAYNKYAPITIIKDIIAFAKNTAPFSYDKIADLVSMAESRGFIPDDNDYGWTVERCCVVASEAMKLATQKDKMNRISFNDQLWLPLVMKWARPWFDLVVVDECQDMNKAQLLLAQKACKAKGRLVLVGDPRQAIYGFRGAEVNGMEALTQKLKAKVFPLTGTYRCGASIVEEAKALVPDYRAAGQHKGEVSVILGDRLTSTVRPGDAIISRSNAPLMGICLNLLRNNVSAYIEGRDVGAQLSKIHMGLAPKAVGRNEYLDRLGAWTEKKLSKLVGNPGSDSYKAAQQNITDISSMLEALAMECDDSGEIGVRLLSLFRSSDDEQTKKSVVLSSIHKAKGLEWGRVFMLRNTLRGVSWTPTVSENNNLAYVAITRAKEHLTWVEGDKFTE